MSELFQLMQIFGAGAEHAAEATEHSAKESQGIAALGIDPLAILAQAGTFLVLFFILRGALTKIVVSLEKRRMTIEDGVRLGLEMEKAREDLKQDVAKELKNARSESDKIIAEGHAEATAIIREAEAVADRKTDTMLQDAHNKIERDIKNARKELEKDMRALVAEATEVIIGEKLDAQKDARLIDKAFQSMRNKA